MNAVLLFYHPTIHHYYANKIPVAYRSTVFFVDAPLFANGPQTCELNCSSSNGA